MAAGRRTVLMVEDEASITEPLSEALEREGFSTEVAGTAAAALEAAERSLPDLVLLDVMLPDGSGFEVCRALRERSRVPIIMLTARGEETDRIVGLELGADDYIVKPFSAREVAARIRAVLRRADEPAPQPDAEPTARSRPASSASTRRAAARPSKPTELDLTRREFELLELLMREAGHGDHPRAPDRRGLGHQLVRLDEDARRPRVEPAAQARRRLQRAALHPHGAWRGLSLRRGRRAGRRMSLRARLLLAFAYVLVLVIVALEVPLALNLSKRVDAEIKSEAQGQAQLLAAGASGRLDDNAQLRPLVESSARDLGGRVIVVDENGALLADSARRSVAGAPSYASRPEIAKALQGQPSQGERRSDSLDQDLLFTAVPIVLEGRPAGAVRVTQSVDAVNDEVRNDVIALVGVGVVALLLGLGVAWLLAGSLAKPLRGLAGSARRVADGDLDARAEVEGSTEQREVATAFNDMTGRLGRSLRAQREFVANASHQLRTPLTGLRLRLEAAAAKSGEPEVREELAAAEHETERLARLLSELLTLAGERERPDPQPVDVGEAAAGAYERWLAPARRSRHVLEVDEGEPAEVCASDEDVAAMLDNLIENALHLLARGHARDDRLAEREQAGADRRDRRGARGRRERA